MRAFGASERALTVMVDRARSRMAFGWPVAGRSVVRQQIALSRNEIGQARLLYQKVAWTIDCHGNKSKEAQVAQIKAIAPQVACNVFDRAIRVHGAVGVGDAFPLARLYAWHRAMRLVDGPDEVHMRTVGRSELGREKDALPHRRSPRENAIDHLTAQPTK